MYFSIVYFDYVICIFMLCDQAYIHRICLHIVPFALFV